MPNWLFGWWCPYLSGPLHVAHHARVDESGARDVMLSSKVTLVYKVALPAIVAGVFGPIQLAWLWNEHGSRPVPSVELVIICVLGFAMLWLCVSLKKVSVSGDRLIISNYLESEAIPLSDIASVSATRFFNPEVIWVRFKRTTTFGRFVLFMPTPRFGAGFSEHPSVQALRTLIAERTTTA